jgi:SAM-dependent methyltransferase
MREAEIRPDHLMAEYLRLSAQDALRFFPDTNTLPMGNCPGCGRTMSGEKFVKNGFPILACESCGTLFANPRPSAEQMSVFYRDSASARYWAGTFFPAVAEARREKIFKPRAKRALELAYEFGPSPQTIVDVGAGIGLFLEEASKLNEALRLRAVEPGRDAARACREKGFETYEGFARDAAGEASWRGDGDLVVSFEVIEHLAEPEFFIRELADLCKPGGLILVSGLCGDGFDIQVLGERANAISPPHHLTFLSQTGVRALFERCEMEILSFETPGQLDVQIVARALKADDKAVSDPDLRRLLLEADETERAAFQASLVEQRKSSHMWILAKRSI